MKLFKKCTKQDVKKKTPFFWGNKKKNGKAVKSGVVVDFKDGTSTTLLTPAGKGTKYAAEMAMGVAITNDGEFKRNADGSEVVLTPEQLAYRGGYLDAQKDSAKAFNAKKNKKAVQ